MTRCLSAGKLWECGQEEGFLRETGGSLVLLPEARRGVFVSRLYDCGDDSIKWDRLKLDAEGDAVFVIRVLILTGEDKKTAEKLKRMEREGKMRAQCRFLLHEAQICSSYGDILLSGRAAPQGRYLKFSVEIFRGGSVSRIALNGYSVSFPRENFTEYLPGIYQNNEALDRYMAVLQTLYLDLEEAVEGIAGELDAGCCREDSLTRLAGWLDMGDAAQLLGKGQVRELLRMSAQFGGRKGTAGYYEELYRRLTGREAVLVEEPEKRACTLLILDSAAGRRRQYGAEDSMAGRRPALEPWELKAALDYVLGQAPLGVHMSSAELKKTEKLQAGCFLDYTAAVSEKDCRIMAGGVRIEDLFLR